MSSTYNESRLTPCPLPGVGWCDLRPPSSNYSGDWKVCRSVWPDWKGPSASGDKSAAVAQHRTSKSVLRIHFFPTFCHNNRVAQIGTGNEPPGTRWYSVNEVASHRSGGAGETRED